MVVVMLGMSVLMTIVATILFRMFRHETTVLTSVAESGVAARIAGIMRDDIHSAKSVSVSANGKTLTVQQESVRIVWSQVSANTIQRTRIELAEDRDLESIPGERFRIQNVKTHFAVKAAENESKPIVIFTAFAGPDPRASTHSRVNNKPFKTKVVACVGLSL
jgi:hypothetical protein